MKVFVSVLRINNDHLESSQHTSSIIQTALKDFTLERIPIINESMLYTKSQVHTGHHCVKSVRTRRYSGPHFHAFGLNTERYRVSLRIQSECGKMRTRITQIQTLLTQCILHTITACKSAVNNCFYKMLTYNFTEFRKIKVQL